MTCRGEMMSISLPFRSDTSRIKGRTDDGRHRVIDMRARLYSRSAVLLSILSCAFVASCSDQPTPEEVVDRTIPALCAKAEACSPSAFASAFPSGPSQCVATVEAEAMQRDGSNPEKRSACSDSELDQCLQDLDAADCEEDELLPKLPCNC